MSGFAVIDVAIGLALVFCTVGLVLDHLEAAQLVTEISGDLKKRLGKIIVVKLSYAAFVGSSRENPRKTSTARGCDELPIGRCCAPSVRPG